MSEVTDRQREYREVYLRSEHWRAVRELALRRATNRCQVCNTQGVLDVHHRTYERLGNEAIEDVIVLCRHCHDLFHGSGRRVKKTKGPSRTRSTKRGRRIIALTPKILGVLHPAVRGMKAGEIAFKLDENPTAVADCLAVMCREGMVQKAGKRYSLTSSGRLRWQPKQDAAGAAA